MTNLQDAILSTVANKGNAVKRLINKHYGSVNNANSLETTLFLLRENRDFAADFTSLMNSEHRNFDAENFGGAVTAVSGAAAGLLSGLYSHRTDMQTSQADIDASLLIANQKAEKEKTYMYVGGAVLIALFVSGAIIMSKQK